MNSINRIKNYYRLPLLLLLSEAGSVHKANFGYTTIQANSITSIKTGGCKEDCLYCAQSSKYKVELSENGYADEREVIRKATKAKEDGCTRFCIGAAWSRPETETQFQKILSLVERLRNFELELCCSLGMISSAQAIRLKEAGVSIYNHNIDTSASYYPNIVTTRSYSDRISTIKNITDAGLELCVGGILGMGESENDRIEMLFQLTQLPAVPESVPVNVLVPIQGTPFENKPLINIWELVRFIATARIVFPTSRIKLSAGRSMFNDSEQALCYLSGANAVFLGDNLLTIDNLPIHSDMKLFEILGLSLER